MGQKVNPHGLRVGIIETWSSKWYAGKNGAAKYILEDHKIREFLKKFYSDASISKIFIERAADKITIDVHCGRPGVAIGKQNKEVKEAGAEKNPRGIDHINKSIRKILGDNREFNVNVHEIKNPDLDAQIVAEGIAASLVKRTPFRRAMKFALGRTMRAGAKGVKTMVSGRLDGAEIARSENYHEGSIPLQTLRAEIDYGFAEAKTTYGIIGVKVWIYKGEVFNYVAKGGKE
ncbi:MAG: 30S ribosomal protein S3 [Firmicutes bacterium]|nr:30S ribosomal protein S3 [Bacillota bacterium]